MEESLVLRIISLFITLFASLCGVGFPLYLGKNFSPEAMKSHVGFTLMRTFSAGIMVGVAFIHLLADAASNLPALVPDYQSLPFALAAAGLVFVLALENIILSSIKPSHTPAVGHDGVFHELKDDEENVPKVHDDITTHTHTHTGVHSHTSHVAPIQDCDGKLCKDMAAVGQDVSVPALCFSKPEIAVVITLSHFKPIFLAHLHPRPLVPRW